jgi:hypothetical protein
MFRHGDVLIIPTTKQDKNKLTKISRKGEDIILAEGETTGHAHRVAAHFLAALYVLQETQQRILQVEAESQVTHEEHNAVVLPPGDYLVVRQQEYTPERVRPVAD